MFVKLFKATNKKLSTASLLCYSTVSGPLEAFLGFLSIPVQLFTTHTWWVLTMVTGPVLIKQQFCWGIVIVLAGSLLADVLRAV